MATPDSEKERRAGNGPDLYDLAVGILHCGRTRKSRRLLSEAFRLRKRNGPGAQITTGAVYKGRWGQYSLWVYNDWYVDDNDIEQPMLPDGVVIMAGPDLMGTRAFGQIIDPNFNYHALPYAPKMWIADDPPQRFLMMQSAPIVIPWRVNAALCATVCAP
jgi:Phage major capsid protein E